MSLRGIDVSEHNGTLNWAGIKSAGISFAILRAGYGRYAVDGQFYANIQGALSQGIPVGVYWFAYALNRDAALEEADKCLATIGDYPLDLPVFYDFEYDTVRYALQQGVKLGKAEFNAFSQAFLERIRENGRRPGIYYNLDYYRTMVDPDILGRYPVWYAQYAAAPTLRDCAIWQYTASGTLSGLGGVFDMNELMDSSLLQSPGWVRDQKGIRYLQPDGSYIAGRWATIDAVRYRFDQEGYLMADTWYTENGKAYYLDGDGALCKDRTLILDGDGCLVPAGRYYERLGQVPAEYREALNKLIASGMLNGKDGSGDNMILDLSEDAVRTLVVLARTLS